MIPIGSNYPESLDTDDNLFLVRDSLRMTLAADYNPGDTSITVKGNPTVLANFPPTGLITLTEQCSDIDLRAISFYYGAVSVTDMTFSKLELLTGFTDVVKSELITDVTLNVMALHHNNLKDALIAIEGFVGIWGQTDTAPFGSTLQGRLNFLQKMIYTPRAWFKSDVQSGLLDGSGHFTVQFSQQCFRLGTGVVTWVWNFGDSTNLTTTNPTIPPKIYTSPGKYDVSLTVTNQFGSDQVVFDGYITVHAQAPEEATIQIQPSIGQVGSLGVPVGATMPYPSDEVPLFDRLGQVPVANFLLPPTIRSLTNTFISLVVPPGIRDNINYIEYSGQRDNSSHVAIDPITTYTWQLADDLPHANSSSTLASYGVGGVYDIVLRVDTSFGSYRITTYQQCIDVIEQSNLWLFLTTNIATNTYQALAYEYGLISETFKTATQTWNIHRSDTFLNNIGLQAPDMSYPASIRAKREFARNAVFTPLGTTSSGSQGTAALIWSGGNFGSVTLPNQAVNFVEYNGFSDTYSTEATGLTRPWNWVFLTNGGGLGYFLFGPDPAQVPNTNYSFQRKDVVNFASSFSITSNTLSSGNYLNGALELQQFVTSGYTGGEPNDGRFAVYRSAWKGQAGYILRNGGVGTFFRLNSFYMTQGTLTDPVVNLTKLPDMAGPVKTEGQLVALNNGIFFFANTGNIAVYDDIGGTWQVGGPSTSSPSFNSLQDSNINDYADIANTLLATGDGDSSAYLSFDYSANAFIKFNSTDMTFSSQQGGRPVGTQFVMGIY